MSKEITIQEALNRIEQGESEMVKIGGCYYDRKILVEQLRQAVDQISLNRMLDSDYKLNVLESMTILSIIKSVE